MTTGEPARVKSGWEEDGELKGVDLEFKMDVKKNKGMCLNRKKYGPEHTGVCIELEFKDVSYTLVEQGAFEYIRRTMIGNPHAKITFKDPTGHKYMFNRAADMVPVLPKEVLPHPRGVTADDLIFMAKHTDKKRFRSLLTSSLSRMSSKRIAEIEEITEIDLNQRPKNMKWEEAERIVEAFSKMEFMAPPTSGLIPIGDKQIEDGMKEILKPEFISTTTRKPVTYRGGIAFIIEAGIAYGGKAGRVVNDQKKSEIMRFANRVPLSFDQGSCAITEALKSIDWRRYGLKDLDNTPLTIFVNMISTQVPYLSTGKQSIAPEPEIIHEVRQATMKVARKLQKHIRSKKAAKEEALRSKIFEDYVPVIIKESAKLAETDVPEYQEVLAKVTRRSLAELLGENPDEVEEESEGKFKDNVNSALENSDTGSSVLDSNAEKESKAKTKGKAKTKTKVKTNPKSKSKPEIKSNGKPKDKSKTRSKVKTKSENKTIAKSKSKVKSKPKVKSKVKSNAKSEVKPKPKNKSESKIKSKVESKIEAEVESKDKVKNKSKSNDTQQTFESR
jgi:DNA topoisomerase-6 subunit B